MGLDEEQRIEMYEKLSRLYSDEIALGCPPVLDIATDAMCVDTDIVAVPWLYKVDVKLLVHLFFSRSLVLYMQLISSGICPDKEHALKVTARMLPLPECLAQHDNFVSTNKSVYLDRYMTSYMRWLLEREDGLPICNSLPALNEYLEQACFAYSNLKDDAPMWMLHDTAEECLYYAIDVLQDIQSKVKTLVQRHKEHEELMQATDKTVDSVGW